MFKKNLPQILREYLQPIVRFFAAKETRSVSNRTQEKTDGVFANNTKTLNC